MNPIKVIAIVMFFITTLISCNSFPYKYISFEDDPLTEKSPISKEELNDRGIIEKDESN